MSVLKVLPEMQQWDENHMYDPGDSTVIDYYIKSKLTTSYVFLLVKYSIMKEYLYVCINKFEYGRKFHSIKEI